jgi:hypothetical protein
LAVELLLFDGIENHNSSIAGIHIECCARNSDVPVLSVVQIQYGGIRQASPRRFGFGSGLCSTLEGSAVVWSSFVMKLEFRFLYEVDRRKINS